MCEWIGDGWWSWTTLLYQAVKRKFIGQYLNDEDTELVHRWSDQTINRSLFSVTGRS